jgi:hypothetical protein
MARLLALQGLLADQFVQGGARPRQRRVEGGPTVGELRLHQVELHADGENKGTQRDQVLIADHAQVVLAADLVLRGGERLAGLGPARPRIGGAAGQRANHQDTKDTKKH